MNENHFADCEGFIDRTQNEVPLITWPVPLMFQKLLWSILHFVQADDTSSHRSVSMLSILMRTHEVRQ